MCNLCDFHEELSNWIKTNSTNNFSAKDATRFTNRVSAIIKSLVDNQFDVLPNFDEMIDEEMEASQNTKFVRIIAEKNGESIEVDLFLSSYMFIHSSKNISGMEVHKLPDESYDYSICFDCGFMDNHEFEASKFFEKILKIHQPRRRLNSKIKADYFCYAKDDVNG